MAARPVPSKNRSVGRYDLVVEIAKSQLGSLWAATTQGQAALEPRLLRRISFAPDTAQADIDTIADLARWSIEFGVEQAAPVLDVVVEPGELALVSGYVPAETLRALLRLASFKRKTIPARVALRVLLDIGYALLAAETRALQAAAGADFCYGGVSPDSILVGTDGTARLIDIGVASGWRSLSGQVNHAEVAAYSAPEQLERGPLDSRTDVFILGVLFWEMLSGGRRLFVGSSTQAVAEKVAKYPIPAITSSSPSETIDAAVQDLIAKMLERDPRRRFRSVSDLVSALEGLAAERLALPIEVSDFVTTFAHSPLSSRERVLDRALARPAPTTGTDRKSVAPQAPRRSQPPSHPPPPQAQPSKPESQLLGSQGPAVPMPLPGAASIPPASGRLDPPRGVAKPLPLPIQAKLGARSSAPDGMLPPLPPPPPPVVATSPKVALHTARSAGADDASSVRAADILRALAVEDSPPSDERPTLRAPEQAALPHPPALRTPTEPDAARLHEARRAPMQTLPGHTSPAPRPPIETLPGHAPPSTSEWDAGAPAAHPAPTALPVPPALPVPEPPAVVGPVDAIFPELRAAPANAQGRSSDDAIVELPARESGWGRRRLPVPLLAAAGGAALLLFIGLAVALGGSTDAGSPAGAQAELVSDATADPKPRTKQLASPEPAAPQTEPERTADAALPASESANHDATEEAAEAKVEAAQGGDDQANRGLAETKKSVAPASPPRGYAPTPAPTPPRSTKQKLRAKRTFIPSGI